MLQRQVISYRSISPRPICSQTASRPQGQLALKAIRPCAGMGQPVKVIVMGVVLTAGWEPAVAGAAKPRRLTGSLCYLWL